MINRSHLFVSLTLAITFTLGAGCSEEAEPGDGAADLQTGDAPAQRPAKNLWPLFNDKLGFVADVDRDNWRFERPSYYEGDELRLAGVNNDTGAKLLIESPPPEEGLSPAGYAARQREALADIENLEVLEDGELEINGAPGYRLEFRLEVEGSVSRTLSYFFTLSERVMSCSLAAEEGDFAAFKPDLDGLVSSFRPLDVHHGVGEEQSAG